MTATVRIWDPLVRIFHWSLVISFATAWLTGDDLENLHHWAGYAAAALIGFRVVWGLTGPGHARFSGFVRGPGTVLGYLRDMAGKREKRYLGHNPAGGAMVVALIVTMAALSLTGWMYTTDAFWGVNWVEESHEILANIMLGLVLVHIGGVALASLRHRENLVRAMFSGEKRAPSGNDIG